MNVKIEIECGNEAFYGYPEGEIARILRDLARSLETYGVYDRKLYDANGNYVGDFTPADG